MGTMERFRECFPRAVEGAGLVALPWYEVIEELMESVNLDPFEDAAGNMPTGHRLSIPGVHSSRSSVLDAMESAHLYRDSLRWCGRRPDCALLLVPRGGAVPLLESQQYRQENSVGVVAVGDEASALELAQILAGYWVEAS